MTQEEFVKAVFARLEDLGHVCEETKDNKYRVDSVEVPLKAETRAASRWKKHVDGRLEKVEELKLWAWLGEDLIVQGMKDLRIAVEKAAMAVRASLESLGKEQEKKAAEERSEQTFEKLNQRVNKACGIWLGHGRYATDKRHYAHVSYMIKLPRNLTPAQEDRLVGWLEAEVAASRRKQADFDRHLGLTPEA